MNETIQQYLKEHGFEQFTPKAVLFDMDGVLIDSMPNHVVAWKESMAVFDIAMTADDAYATEGARGVDTIRKMVKEQHGRDIDEAEAQQMYDVKSRIFNEQPLAPVMNGVRGLLRKISRDGLRIIVVTGSGQRPLIQRLSEEFPKYISEDQIITAYDVKRGKPAPDPYLMGLKRAGDLQPWEAIVVENAPLGVRAGAAANIFTVAVNSGPLPNEALKEAGANIVFDSMTDFRDHWDRMFAPELIKNGKKKLNQNDEKWERMYQQVMDYMETNKRRPSKYHPEDRKMHAWIKYNKKRLIHNAMPKERAERFRELLLTAIKYWRSNQYNRPSIREFDINF